MSKRPLNENIVIDFVEAVFNAIINQRNKAIERAAAKDPEFQRITKQIETGRNDLIQWAEEKAKTDPNFARTYQAMKSAGMV